MHKRHLNQLTGRISNEADSSPSEETVMDFIYDTLNISTPLAAPEIKLFDISLCVLPTALL